jgi:hypothetical protein
MIALHNQRKRSQPHIILSPGRGYIWGLRRPVFRKSGSMLIKNTQLGCGLSIRSQGGNPHRLYRRFGGGERKRRRDPRTYSPRLGVEGLSPKRCVEEQVGSQYITRWVFFWGGRRKQTAPYTTSRAPTALRPSVWNDEVDVWPFAASALPQEKTAAVGAVCVTANTPMHGRSGRRRAVRRSAGVHTGKSTRIGSRRDRAACTTAPVLSQDASRRGPSIAVGRRSM